MSSTDYEFDWDDNKATINLGKHGVDFREAMTVMLDPLAMTFFDAEHSQDEERWISVGRSSEGTLLLVVQRLLPPAPVRRWCASSPPGRLPETSASSMSKVLCSK